MIAEMDISDFKPFMEGYTFKPIMEISLEK